MSVFKIREYPDKILKKKCRPVEIVDDSVKRLIADMLEVMYAHGGVGLAANQVGRDARVCVVDVRGGGQKKPMALVNPKITLRIGRAVYEEGCLSFPGVLVDVRRYERIRVEALNVDAMPVDFEASGMLSRVIQHETDHLDGKTFFDRLPLHKKLKAYYVYRKLKKSAADK
jgi:peptide deformylase